MTEIHLNDQPTPGEVSAGSPIGRIDLYSYDVNYVGSEYVMSGGRIITTLQSTVAKVTTEDGLVGFGETCPLGSNYLPAHAAGVRAALTEVAPSLVGLDGTNPALVARAMDTALLGHGYAKSAIDVACWDVLGQASGRPICDLIGGRSQTTFPLYVAIPLGSPEAMADHVRGLRDQGVHRFQLKLGGRPAEDARRAQAVCEATMGEDTVFGDANCGWSLREAIAAARLMEDLPNFYLEQPCATFEECLRVREHTSLPMILDEIIVDVQSLLRAWEARALEGFNLKVNRAGGLTHARLIRDIGERLGLIVNVEDSWGGDITTAAVSHLAASTGAETLQMVSFMNDWVREHVAGHQPRSGNGMGAAPPGPGLGIEVQESMLGTPFASFTTGD